MLFYLIIGFTAVLTVLPVVNANGLTEKKLPCKKDNIDLNCEIPSNQFIEIEQLPYLPINQPIPIEVVPYEKNN